MYHFVSEHINHPKLHQNSLIETQLAIKINYNVVIAAIIRFYKKIRKIRMFYLEEIIGLCLIPKTPPKKSFFLILTGWILLQ